MTIYFVLHSRSINRQTLSCRTFFSDWFTRKVRNIKIGTSSLSTCSMWCCGGNHALLWSGTPRNVHLITDGVDTYPRKHIRVILKKVQHLGFGFVCNINYCHCHRCHGDYYYCIHYHNYLFLIITVIIVIIATIIIYKVIIFIAKLNIPKIRLIIKL